MKRINKILCTLSTTILLSLSGCNNKTSSIDSSKQEPKREPPEFLTSLPIPSELKKTCEKRGTLEVFNYETKVYDLDGNGTTTVSKQAEVYLPYGYDDTGNYNVLYLMHGGGEDCHYWLTKEKDTIPVLDNIFANGIAEPCIVVAPSFYTGTSSSGQINSEITDVFRYEFRYDLVPNIEKEYATYCNGDTSIDNLIETREHRGFAGLSMGSMTSIRSALLGNLDICAYISSMSGGYDQNDDTGERGYELIREALNETFYDYPIKYWLNQNGTDDIALGPHQALHNLVITNLTSYLVEDENYKWILF